MQLMVQQWTQADTPGAADVWTDGGACAAQRWAHVQKGKMVRRARRTWF
jgi:hypothetical protein